MAAHAEIARRRGLISICDNTFMTPCFQRPLEWGIDVVVHSTTKYLNGHSGVVGGFCATNDDALAERMRFLQNAIGAVPSPMDAFLVLRGVKTLVVRMERHEQNARAVCEHLLAHPRVERVTWPGLGDHALARRQMNGFGGMVTFVIKGGLPAARAFLRALKVFACAEFLGGVESLAEHPALMTHASVPSATRERLGIGDGLIRLSIGIEDPSDLIADLSQALEAQ